MDPAGPTPEEVAAQLHANVAVDFKAQINHICQKLRGGQIQGGELMYQTSKYGYSQFQSTIKLMCLPDYGQPEFAGAVCQDAKAAERAAAQQAIIQCLPLYLEHATNEPAKKKKKKGHSSGTIITCAPLAPQFQMALPTGAATLALTGGQGVAVAPGALPGAAADGSGLSVPMLNLLANLETSPDAPLQPPQPEPTGPCAPEDIVNSQQVASMMTSSVAVNFMSQLNHMCQKVKGGQIRSGEIMYTVQKYSMTQFQATVKLLCLETMSQPEFAGNVCSNPKDAEKDASLQAIKFLMPTYQQVSAARPQRQNFGQWNGGGYGKGKGKGRY